MLVCCNATSTPAISFLYSNGIAFQSIGHHIVDVLDEDNIRIKVVQVLNQRAMTAGTEQQLAVVAERLVVHIGGNGIGARLLFGESDVIIHPIRLGISRQPFRLPKP